MIKGSAIVIGAGIVGLATARALALKDYEVTVIERNKKAVGASIRNFGMLWPVGQPDGILYDRAMRSKIIWKEVADKIGLWHDEVGSLHVAHNAEEWQVLQELKEAFTASGRCVRLMDKTTILNNYQGINANGLLGGLYSGSETIVDPREAVAAIPDYLKQELDVQFIWDKTVTQVETGMVWMGNNNMRADIICICAGADFETLYPDVFKGLPVTKCKLQMMRFAPPTENWRMGVSLCGGLSLVHYDAFKAAQSLPKLKEKYQNEMAEYLKWGIHVMVSQNGRGELTVGDSHEYGLTFDPFDKSFINEMILKYLGQFAVTDNWKLIQTWHGIYPKMTNGEAGLFLQPNKDVYIVNSMGGIGMTMSFGFAEEMFDKI